MPLIGVCILFLIYIFYIIKYSTEVNKRFKDKKTRKEFKNLISNVNHIGLAIYFSITYFCEIKSIPHIILTYLLVAGMIFYMRKKYIEMKEYRDSNHTRSKNKAQTKNMKW